MTQREYLAKRGAVCPFCESDEIDGEQVEIEDGAWQRVTCARCGREWHDSYVLSGFLAFDEKCDVIPGAEGGDPTRIVVEIAGGVVTAVARDGPAEVHVVDYDSIADADVERLGNYAGSHGDANGVGYDAVAAALARTAKVIDEQRRRLADAHA